MAPYGHLFPVKRRVRLAWFPETGCCGREQARYKSVSWRDFPSHESQNHSETLKHDRDLRCRCRHGRSCGT